MIHFLQPGPTSKFSVPAACPLSYESIDALVHEEA